MGNKIDKMDEELMQYAPLDQEVIYNLYFIHDAFRYMDLISLACESIIRPTNESHGRVSSLQDFGTILKSTGKQIRRDSTFSKILVAVGELEILIGKMENNWTYDIDELLVKPIQKCICIDSEELSMKRNQIMSLRNQLMEAKKNKSGSVKALDNEYRQFQDDFKDRLISEKKLIMDFRRNLSKVLEKQLEMNQNSTIHLEALVDLLKKNPKKIKISKDSSSDSVESKLQTIKNRMNLSLVSPSTSALYESFLDLPDLQKPSSKDRNIFSKFIYSKMAQAQTVKGQQIAE